MPFDWYTLNFGDFLPWLGSVMQSIYFVWEALWTPLAYLPNVGIHPWSGWIVSLWNLLLTDVQNQPNFLGSITLVELALGGYLIISIGFLLVKALISLFKR